MAFRPFPLLFPAQPRRRPWASFPPKVALLLAPSCSCAGFFLLALITLPAVLPSAPDPAASPDRVTAFRLRSDFLADLEDDSGWAAPPDTPATLQADQPFRLRFEIESLPGAGHRRQFSLQYRWNEGPWTYAEAQDFPLPASATPIAGIVSCPAYAFGALAGDLLSASPAPAYPGTGIALAPTTPAWSQPASSTEFEWALVVRRYADGPLFAQAGDTFAFRLVDALGTPLSGPYPVLTLAVPPGHLGGTFVETPARIGPYEAADGTLAFLMEPAETDNRFMVVQSRDHGLSWSEADGPHRPAANDLEGVASLLLGDTIHILHQTSRIVYYHSFRTADHPTHPSTWWTDSAILARHPKPPAQVAALTARPDGSLVGAFAGATTIHLLTRSPSGQWSQPQPVDLATPHIVSSPQLLALPDGRVLLACADSAGSAWFRFLLPGGSLSPATLLDSGLGTSDADRIPLLTPVYLPGSGDVVVLYRKADGFLWERRVSPAGRLSEPFRATPTPVVTDAVDSQQPGADLLAHGDTLHLLFITADTREIFHTRSTQPGQWTEPARVISGIQGSWVRGGLLRHHPQSPAYGFVYDAGSRGGSGLNRFACIPLPGSPAQPSPHQP